MSNKYLDFTGLSTYDQKIKEYIGNEDDAVEKQVTDLKNAINDIIYGESQPVTEHTPASDFTAMDGYVIGSDGVPSESANYITFYKEFSEDANIWFVADDKTHYSAFLAISTKTGTNYTARQRYISGSEDYL